MKLNFFSSILMLLVAVSFFSCDKAETENTGMFEEYIINYGSYSGEKSSITGINFATDSTLTDYYESVNSVSILSNIQYAYKYNGQIYFMGNNVDQVFFVDATTFTQTKNGITEDIIKPRYCVGNGNYLYVSCWGGDVWVDNTLSYIAKLNLTTNKVEKTIALPGGPEGLAIANNKLYAALNYKDSVAVMDLSDETFTYIATPAVSTYFMQDNNDNLYVSLISSYSMPSTTTGLGYINTSNNKLDAVYEIAGVSTSYVNIMASNSDFSKIYLMTSAYDTDWNLVGAVAEFNVASKSFSSELFLKDIASLNGIEVYDNNVLCFISESVTGGGVAKLYNSSAKLLNEYKTGISPFMLLTNE